MDRIPNNRHDTALFKLLQRIIGVKSQINGGQNWRKNVCILMQKAIAAGTPGGWVRRPRNQHNENNR
jgi:hypothetical protein